MTDMWLYIGMFIAVIMVLVGIFLILKSSRQTDVPAVNADIDNRQDQNETQNIIANTSSDDASANQDAAHQDLSIQQHAALQTTELTHDQVAPETAVSSVESADKLQYQSPAMQSVARLVDAATETDTVNTSATQSVSTGDKQSIHSTSNSATSNSATVINPTAINSSYSSTDPVSDTGAAHELDHELNHQLNHVLHQLDEPEAVPHDAHVVYQIDDTQAAQPISLVSVENLDQQPLNANILDAHLSEQDRLDEESSLATAQKLVALYLYPSPSRALSGERTLKILTKYGLRYGELSCFHRYQDPEKASPLMFSVLRLNDDGAPSGFDLETLSNEEVKGLAFFLALPNVHAVTGYDMMVSLSGLMARDVDGMVFDEQGLELTPQLRDHWRHQVIEMNSKPLHNQ